ncbi:MAG: flagellar basal body P-ring protein FlgI [Planctomycetota bacterium]|jgi:hypothetical protein
MTVFSSGKRMLGMSLVAAIATGCSLVEKAGPQPVSSRADGSAIQLDVPRIMQGTVASETVLLGFPSADNWRNAATVVKGYGLVVGLNGTGSRDVPAPVRAYMRIELTRGGFGSERHGYGHLTPDTVLDSMDTAVVIVEAVVPPAALEGTRFDIRVYADPRSGTTSLEGGRLYTTPLRPGELSAGGGQAFPLADAHGPIFINPFAEPGATGRDTVNRTVGRVLNGGQVLKDMPMKLQLATPSHARTRHIENAINSRFPIEPGQPNPTARGESDEVLTITVPPSYRDRTAEFVALLQHTTIRTTSPESVALSVRRSLVGNPAYAPTASLRWQALGTRSLPIIKDLYDYPEELPRLGALSAGAKLDDGLVVPHLIEMTRSASYESRIQAIELLADMRSNPRIDRALRDLLDDEDVEVRLASYEAIVGRRDPHLSRHYIDGGKFVVDVIDSSHPMVYITQIGEPRIVIFGDDLKLESPLQMPEHEKLEVYYREENAQIGTIHESDADLVEIVQLLGHSPSPEAPAPGLAFSYGETVGALHQIWRQGHLKADFKAEQDRILAAIVRQEQEKTSPERSEFDQDDVPATSADTTGDLSGASLGVAGDPTGGNGGERKP